jgi:hypothetical protein
VDSEHQKTDAHTALANMPVPQFLNSSTLKADNLARGLVRGFNATLFSDLVRYFAFCTPARVAYSSPGGIFRSGNTLLSEGYIVEKPLPHSKSVINPRHYAVSPHFAQKVWAALWWES